VVSSHFLEMGLEPPSEELPSVQPQLLVGVAENIGVEFKARTSLDRLTGMISRRSSPGRAGRNRHEAWTPFKITRRLGVGLGLCNQEAAQEDAQAQTQEDARRARWARRAHA